jgi:dihydropteroate synthase
MHMRGTPQTMQLDPRYDDVVAEIHAYLRQRRDALVAAGIPLDRICLDPGIGFGKTHAHNLALMAEAGQFLDLGCPVLVGHSRKGFIGKQLETALGRPATQADRDAGTAGAACGLAAAGVQIVRVHAVGLVRAALELFAATTHGPAAPGLARRPRSVGRSQEPSTPAGGTDERSIGQPSARWRRNWAAL